MSDNTALVKSIFVKFLLNELPEDEAEIVFYCVGMDDSLQPLYEEALHEVLENVMDFGTHPETDGTAPKADVRIAAPYSSSTGKSYLVRVVVACTLLLFFLGELAVLYTAKYVMQCSVTNFVVVNGNNPGMTAEAFPEDGEDIVSPMMIVCTWHFPERVSRVMPTLLPDGTPSAETPLFYVPKIQTLEVTHANAFDKVTLTLEHVNRFVNTQMLPRNPIEKNDILNWRIADSIHSTLKQNQNDLNRISNKQSLEYAKLLLERSVLMSPERKHTRK